MTSLQFQVPGIPAPGGSKRFVGFGKKTGRAILIDAGGQKNKDWRNAVMWAGREAIGQQPLFTGPLHVTMRFLMPRPKGHFRTNGDLKPNAPNFPTTKPDALKLARSTEDALTGVAWNDDAQTVSLEIHKCYVGAGEAPGARIHILPHESSSGTGARERPWQ